MLTQLFAIARAAFVESVRQPILFVLVLLCGILQVFNTWNAGYTLADSETSQVSGDTKLLFDMGLATIFVIGTLLAGFIATAVISREIENKTVLTIVSKPVGRPVVVFGKFIGVAGAILAAVIVMLVFLMMAIRHGVMSTASHEVDGPVLAFGLGFVFISLALAGWCNYFYGWNFPQTFVSLLVPLSLLAYVGVLLVDKNWRLQPLTADFKDQVVIASLCLGMAILVLTSVALAASTRLGQVATVFVCFGVFLAALLSHYFVGRRVFQNELVGIVAKVEPEDASRPALSRPGDYCKIELTRLPTRFFEAGAPIFFSPSPSGFPMLYTGSSQRFSGNIEEMREALNETVQPRVAIVSAEGATLRVRRIGPGPLPMLRPPESQDYIFLKPTTINAPALVVWGIVPNLQFFWLLDAVSQNRPVPPLYLGLIGMYTVCQVGVFLSLAVILFQRRDVG